MDINSDGDSSSIFKPYTTRTGSKEDENINKTTDNSSSNNGGQSKIFDDVSRLPDGLKNCISDDLIGQPLQDIDPFYANKETFIVVNKNRELHRFSSTKALWLFSTTNKIRRTAIRILVNPWYARFMIAVILAFCVMNASIQPSFFDLRYYLIVFLTDFILKIFSHGFLLSPFSYLRSGWNILDLVLDILLLCGTPILAELRILKIISLSINLQQTVRFYWSSCKLLRDLVLYICLILAIVSTFFLQIYMGTLRQTCVEIGSFGSNNYNNLYALDNQIVRCGNASGSQACPHNYICLQGTDDNNPDFGLTHFDNIFSSLLSTFRLITRDFWENLAQLIIVTCGPWHIIAFIGIIFFGSFQLFSIIWGQIAVSYNYIKVERWEKELMPEQVQVEEVETKGTNNSKDTSPGCWSKFQRFFFYIIYNPYTVLFVIICIVLNTLCMALDHHGMPKELDTILRIANSIFVVIFVIEAVLKLLALGIIRYFKDEWNTFDFIVTLLGAIEIALQGFQGLSVFRSFRLLRPLRLGKIVPAFDLLLTRIQHVFSLIAGQTIIFCMFIYIFVVFGCKQFSSNYGSFDEANENDELPLWRFTDVFHSFMVVFRALCGEWIETLILIVHYNGGAISYIYYICLVVIGSFLIMHLFVALIFTSDDSTALPAKIKQQQVIKSAKKSNEKFYLGSYLKDKLLEPSIKKIFNDYEPKKDIESNGEQSDAVMVSKSENINDIEETVNKTEDTSIPIEPIQTTNDESSLKFTEDKYYKHFSTFVVLITCISLALQFDIDANSRIGLRIIYLEYFFIGLMAIDFLISLTSRGWKCFMDIWSLVDLFNIICFTKAPAAMSGASGAYTALFQYIAVLGIFHYSRTLLVLSSFRPLSLVSRCNLLQIIANTISKQVWMLSNTILICLAFWLIFAIMGVQMFAGKFSHCVDNTNINIDTVTDQAACEANQYIWINSFMNFDNVIQSYYCLLQVSTFKGWITIINDAVNSRGVDEQPSREVNIYMFLYFVIFIVFAVFMCLNVLVGILVQHQLHTTSLTELLNKSNRKSESSSNGTDDKVVTNELNSSSSKLINFVRSHVFDKIALVACLAYCVLLMFDHYQMSNEYNTVTTYVLMVSSILLIIEVSLRGYALRKDFIVNPWNRFDIVVVIFVIMEFFLMELVAMYFVSSFLLRIIRILRFNAIITSSSKSLQCVGKVLSKTLKVVSMLFIFLLLIIFIYALIGTILFHKLKIVFGSFDIFNFQTLGQSVILLIQLSTSAAWDGVLKQISVENSYIATAYLLSFLFISLSVILNVIILIALEFYKEVTAIDDEKTRLQSNDLNDFNDKWETFALDDRKYMAKNRLSDFLNSLDAASTLRLPNANENEVKLLGIQSTKDNTYCQRDVLIALNRIRLNKQ